MFGWVTVRKISLFTDGQRLEYGFVLETGDFKDKLFRSKELKILMFMKRIICCVIMAAGMVWSAAAKEFESVPRAWKWLNNKEAIFSYDGSFADSAAFVVDAVTGKQRTGVKAPAKYSDFPVKPEGGVNLTYSPDSTKIAFTRNNDLYVVDIASGAETRLTFDGNELILKEVPFGMISLAGGLKNNAIPRDCSASLLVPEECLSVVETIISEQSAIFKKEFFASDAEVQVTMVRGEVSSAEILDFMSLNKILCYLRMVPNGVQHMSQAIPGLVETSLNLGIMELKEDVFVTDTSIRSSVRSRKEDVRDKLVNIIEVCGGEADVVGDYPAWEYKAESKLREEIAAAYKTVYGKDLVFTAIHAGLECGILSEKIEGLDCVSFGPQNYDIHTPQERLSIESTERVWNFLVEYLKQAK